MNGRGSTTVKVILGIALTLVLCVALAAYVWWHNTGSAMYDAVAGSMQEGRRVGLTVNATGCVDSMVGRHIVAVANRPATQDTAQMIKDIMREPMFFSGCLMVSKPSPELCAAVPPSSDPARGRVWAKEQCEERHASDTSCPALLLGPLQAYCNRQGRAAGSRS